MYSTWASKLQVVCATTSCERIGVHAAYVMEENSMLGGVLRRAWKPCCGEGGEAPTHEKGRSTGQAAGAKRITKWKCKQRRLKGSTGQPFRH
mmetsp:Transcript_137281/g.238656  ORF Transcript_137281/g.238656 Transcript_137281/m.238656 type:complete len:92 (+) Transcript_137281:100-375(+)